MTTIAERIKEIRKTLGVNQSVFAAQLGIGQSTLAMLEVSKRPISDRHVKTICAICKVNEEWLRTGVGAMFERTELDVLDLMAQKYHLNDAEREVAKYCLELSSEQRKSVLQHILNIAEVIKRITPEQWSPEDERLAAIERRRAAINAELDAEKREIISSVSTQDAKRA